jgi:hypothetical protein
VGEKRKNIQKKTGKEEIDEAKSEECALLRYSGEMKVCINKCHFKSDILRSHSDEYEGDVFWGDGPCSLLEIDRRFRSVYCFLSAER